MKRYPVPAEINHIETTFGIDSQGCHPSMRAPPVFFEPALGVDSPCCGVSFRFAHLEDALQLWWYASDVRTQYWREIADGILQGLKGFMRLIAATRMCL